MMEVKRSFEDGDRYKYDFEVCTTQKGWAQLDSGQDAWYFGSWVNPFELKALCYCEGDVSLYTFEDEKELDNWIGQSNDWNNDNGHGSIHLDPGFNKDLKAKFVELGLGNWLD